MCADEISAAADLVTALAALGALVVAAIGLTTWRRELRGREEFALARETLRAVYRVRDEIRHVRNPSMYPSEWADRPGRDEHQPVSDPKDVEHAYQKRWDRFVDVSGDLDSRLLEAEVLWGPSLAPPRDELRRLVARLNVNLRKHLRTLTNEQYSRSLSAEQINGIDAIIWEGYEDPDPFAAELAGVFAQFESTLRPHLGRTS